MPPIVLVVIMAIGDTGCLAYTPTQETAYGYVPSLAAGIVYCALFGLSMLAHVYQTIRYRSWWTFVFAVGALSKCPLETSSFASWTKQLTPCFSRDQPNYSAGLRGSGRRNVRIMQMPF